MKLAKLILSVIALIVCTLMVIPVNAEPAKMPSTGTYFIVSASTGEALQPNAPMLGQNVFLQAYNKSGAQKWLFTRKIDPKTKKPTNRYTIRLAGEQTDLNFHPYDIGDHTAILNLGVSAFVVEPGEEGFLIKSVRRNGDALFAHTVPDTYTEAHFGPSDGSTKFRWQIEPAN